MGNYKHSRPLSDLLSAAVDGIKVAEALALSMLEKTTR